MTEIQLNMYHALALGAAMYALGLVLTKKLPVFSRFCIPAPLVGGLCFAIFNTILYATGTAVITFDDTLQTVFMSSSLRPSASPSAFRCCSRAANPSSCSLF